MNCIINGIKDLLTGPSQCSAIALAVVAFILGMIVMCLVCKLFKPCKCAAPKAAPRHTGAVKFEKKHPAPADGSIEIYVGNLSYDLTEDQLRKEFEAFGKVNSARIITNRFNGKSKGFGFVHMPNRAEVDAAIKALSDKEILGRKLKCNEAKNVG